MVGRPPYHFFGNYKENRSYEVFSYIFYPKIKGRKFSPNFFFFVRVTYETKFDFFPKLKYNLSIKKRKT